MILLSEPASAGAALRKLRKARGMRIGDVAQLSGMLRPNISRIELGNQTPGLERLIRLAAVFGYVVALVPAEGRGEHVA